MMFRSGVVSQFTSGTLLTGTTLVQSVGHRSISLSSNHNIPISVTVILWVANCIPHTLCMQKSQFKYSEYVVR